MRTSKPISTISYNTDDFLEMKLNELITTHYIEYWCYVKHLGEVDEDGVIEKDHKHVLMIPNGRIDTMDIQDKMTEIDLFNPSKPLKCIDFRNSKVDEWFLYCSHDETYLKTKFLEKQYSYTLKDFVSSDVDETAIKWDRAFHESDYMKNQRMLKLLEKNTASQLVAQGFVQPQQAFQMQVFYKMLCQGQLQDVNKNTLLSPEIPFEEV